MLDIWPAMIPIVVLDHSHPTSCLPISNVVAALEHRHRIYGIWLNNLTETQWQLIIEKTQEQFPELTLLELVPELTTELTLPLEFLGGSAPCLRVAQLDSIRFDFQHYRIYFRLPGTLLAFDFTVYLSKAMFHRWRWSPASLHRSISGSFSLNSDPQNRPSIGQSFFLVHGGTSSSPLSPSSRFAVSASTWRIL